jgi:hypothetical protein
MVSYLRFRSALCSVLCIATKYGWLEQSTLSPNFQTVCVRLTPGYIAFGMGGGEMQGVM